MEKGLSRMTGKPLGLSSLKSCSGERNAVKAARGKRWKVVVVLMGNLRKWLPIQPQKTQKRHPTHSTRCSNYSFFWR